MQGPDLYTLAHKALRAELATLVQWAGRLDAADPGDLRAYGTALARALANQRTHSAHESRCVVAVLRQFTADAAVNLVRDHDQAERRTGELEAMWEAAHDGGDPAALLAFYRTLNLFVADYLRHLAEEERDLPGLWGRLTPPQMRTVLREMSRVSCFEEILGNAPALLPHISPPERVALLSMAQQQLSPERFAQVRDAVRDAPDSTGTSGAARNAEGRGI